MSFFGSMTEKSWLAEVGAVAESQKGPLSNERIALRFFLGAVSILFFLFVITFLSRSQFPDFVPLSGQPWQPFTDASQLWLNTIVLLAASVAMQWGVYASKHAREGCSVAALSLAIMLSFSFLIAQLMVWQQMIALGFYVGSNPANSFYYLLTAIHGLHVVGGLVVLLRAAYRFTVKHLIDDLHVTLSLCATYWHFLFVVWLILFSLLTSDAETYAYIAALCGF